MTAKVQSNAKYVSGALLIHALIAGVFIAASLYSPHIIIPQLGIKGSLIDSTSLNLAKKVEPKPEPDVDEQQKQEEQKKQEQLEQERQKEKDREIEKQKEEQLRSEQQEQEKQEKEKQAEQQRIAEAQQAAKRQKVEAEKKRVEEIKQKQADAKAQAAREAELKAQLADEESRNSAVSSGVLARWQAEVMAKIRMKWKQPPTARKGTDCDVAVVQSPNGNVIRAQVTRCNGDVAVKQSIETAVLDASPLPLPSDMHVFTRSFTVRFHPEE